ncbi:MAG: TlpA disulfide reductase family protein [Armatimonadota bacterium]|nr:TlpA disulfide reductase family protein [Armatimonadota bacterium]MDR7487015.1 TlpA disulfide reductase family protein [Armatimonadota bacterium]MDR7533407.1 TlpA disulfide reductase family protein [Armatimonadota bacterium]MDR7535225.1 TlpA disulfide reductase family protein [Armatimonadota bacterium]
MTRTLHPRVPLLAAVGLVVAALAFVTARAGRQTSISGALARGLAPEAPPFTLPRLDGDGTLDLAALRGRVVVLNFWASWCVPCRDEAPLLEAAWQRYRDRGVVVVGVNVQDLTADAQRFVRETRTTFPVVRDHDNRVYRAYGLTGVPETFFTDRQGRIVRKFPGAVLEAAEWFRAVEDVLAR